MGLKKVFLLLLLLTHLPCFSDVLEYYKAYIPVADLQGETYAVDVVNTASNTVIKTIPVGTLGNFLAVSPDNQLVYVVLEESICVIDTATDTVSKTISFESPRYPMYLVFSSDSQKAYVTASDGSISVVDVAAHQVEDFLLLSQLGLNSPPVLSPDNSTLYVSDPFSVYVVAANPISPITTVSGGGGSFGGGIAITSDGSQVYAAVPSPPGIDNGFFAMTTVNNQGAFNPVNSLSQGTKFAAITPDGSKAYFSAGGQVVIANTQGSTATTIDGGSDFQDVVAAPNGERVYVSDTGNSSIVSIDTSDDEAFNGIVSVEITPHFAITPDSSWLYALNLEGFAYAIDTNAFEGDPLTIPLTAMPTNYVAITPGLFYEDIPEDPPQPPEDVFGGQAKMRFLTQADLINVIRWQPPSSGTAVIGYRIYLDEELTDLAAFFDVSQKREFTQHNCKPNQVYTYYIVSEAAEGVLSTPIALQIGSAL